MPPPAPHPSPLVVGVLGGIASGKSFVATRLAGASGLVIRADELAREALETPEVRTRLRARFGPYAFGPDGSVDRAFLARAVFDPEQGPENRAALESFTHPLVRARISARLDSARAAGVARIVLDVPLLLENDAQHGLARLCHVLVFVDTEADERDRRAQRERGWASGEVARREAAQLPLSEKKQRADYILPNHHGIAELERALAELEPELAGRRQAT